MNISKYRPTKKKLHMQSCLYKERKKKNRISNKKKEREGEDKKCDDNDE
jgi:hypothetical protein